MVYSRIPGPLGLEPDEAGGEERRWPYAAGRPFRHHQPGPLGIDSESDWLHKRLVLSPSALREDELVRDLMRWEGNVPFMYLDTKGLVTVGIGNLLRTVQDAIQLPFVNQSTNEEASSDEIAAAFEAVTRKQAGMPWPKYKLSPSLELPIDTCRELALRRLKTEFIPALRRAFPLFDDYPVPARHFMIDMAYNGGVGYFRKRNMVELIRRHQWLDLIPLLPLRGNPRRGAWREALLRRAAGL